MFRLIPQAIRSTPTEIEVPASLNTDQRSKEKMVASAVAENRLRIAFQPIVSARNSKIPAFQECLVRIEGRNGDIIPAAQFMPDVEPTDLGRIVDRIVLRQVLQILEDTPRVRLSVNLSAKGIGDQEWLNILRTACDRAPQCGELLIVEITESSMLDLSPKDIDFLFELRALGCSIALDDFGAGHTSISHLGKFRFDFLKIDGTFIQGLSDNLDKQFLVKSMVSIARHFEMVCVAEMVDNKKDAKRLRDMGVDCFQGYYFGKPTLTPAWLNSQSRRRFSLASGEL